MTAGIAPIVIYPSRLRMLPYFVLCVACVAAAMWFGFVHADAREVFSPQRLVALYVGLPCLGAVTLYYLYRLVRRRPTLVIGDDGIRYNAPFGFPAMIRWDNIRALSIWRQYRQRFLSITLKDYDAAFGQQNGLTRVARRLLLWPMVPNSISIPQAMVSMRLEEVEELIRIRARSYAPLP